VEKETRCKEWQLCVEEWQSLKRQFREGTYEPPVVCLAFNGASIPLIVHNVEVRSGRSPCETTVILTVEGGVPLVLTEARPVRFKSGKDRGGKGKTIFLTDLNR
jgi:hypothetical protein